MICLRKSKHQLWRLVIVLLLTLLFLTIERARAADAWINGEAAITGGAYNGGWNYATGNFLHTSTNNNTGPLTTTFTGSYIVNTTTNASTTHDIGINIGANSDIVRIAIIGNTNNGNMQDNGSLITQDVIFSSSVSGISVAKSGFSIDIGYKGVTQIGDSGKTTVTAHGASAITFTNTTGNNYVNIHGSRGWMWYDSDGPNVGHPIGGVYPIRSANGAETVLQNVSNNNAIVGGAGNEIIYLRGADGLDVTQEYNSNMLTAENGGDGGPGGLANGQVGANGEAGHGSNNPQNHLVTQFANGGKALVNGGLSLGDGDNVVIVEGGDGGRGGNGGNGGDGGRGGNGGDGVGVNGGPNGGVEGGVGGLGGNGGRGGDGWHGGIGGEAKISGNIKTGSGDDTIILRGGAAGVAGSKGVYGAKGGDGGRGGSFVDLNQPGTGGNGGVVGMAGNAGNGGNGGKASIEGNIDLGDGNDIIRMLSNPLPQNVNGVISEKSTIAKYGDTAIISSIINFGLGDNRLVVDMNFGATATIKGEVKAESGNGKKGRLDLLKAGDASTTLNLNKVNDTTTMTFENVYLQAGKINSNLAHDQLKIGTLHFLGEDNIEFLTEENQVEIKNMVLALANNVNASNNNEKLKLTINANLKTTDLTIGGGARFSGGYIATDNLLIAQNAPSLGGFYSFAGNLYGAGNNASSGDILVNVGGKINVSATLNVSGPNDNGQIDLTGNNNKITFYIADTIPSLTAVGNIKLKGNDIEIIGVGGRNGMSYAIINSGGGLQADEDRTHITDKSWLLNYRHEYKSGRLLVYTEYDQGLMSKIDAENKSISEAFFKLLDSDVEALRRISGYTLTEENADSELNKTFKQLSATDSVNAVNTSAMSDIKMMNSSLKNQFNTFRAGHKSAGMASLKAHSEIKSAAGGIPAHSAKSVKKAYGGKRTDDIYVLREWNGFFQFFGGYGSQQTVGTNTGYEFGGWGLMTGLDYLVAKELRFGALFGYSHNRSDVFGGYGMSEDSVLRFGAYGSYNWDKFFFDSAMTCGVHFLDSKRNFDTLLAQGTARGERTGFDYTWMNHVGYSFAWGSGIIFTPVYSLDFGLMYNPSYTETGSTWNLAMGSYTNYSLLQNIDFKFGKLFSISRNFSLLPELWFGWELEYINGNGAVAASFASMPQNTWNTPVSKTDANRATFGLGLSALVYDSTTIFGRWDQKVWGSGYETAFTFGVQINF